MARHGAARGQALSHDCQQARAACHLDLHRIWRLSAGDVPVVLASAPGDDTGTMRTGRLQMPVHINGRRRHEFPDVALLDAIPPCRGRTMTRLKSGELHRVFPSALPNGSHKTRRPPHVFCMFDTVFHEADETFYIMDCLAWNGVHLCSSSVGCRSAWARVQFAHSAAAAVRVPAADVHLLASWQRRGDLAFRVCCCE
jgi:hypothetical protein